MNGNCQWRFLSVYIYYYYYHFSPPSQEEKKVFMTDEDSVRFTSITKSNLPHHIIFKSPDYQCIVPEDTVPEWMHESMISEGGGLPATFVYYNNERTQYALSPQLVHDKKLASELKHKDETLRQQHVITTLLNNNFFVLCFGNNDLATRFGALIGCYMQESQDELALYTKLMRSFKDCHSYLHQFRVDARVRRQGTLAERKRQKIAGQ